MGALVMVVVETMAEAVADKARINFVFSSTNIGNTYTYTSPCDRFEKERQNQSVSGERENRVFSVQCTTLSFILYHKSVVTKGTEQFLFLRYNNITHYHQKKVTFYFYIFSVATSHTLSTPLSFVLHIIYY